MIISLKGFQKTQQPFMIKVLERTGIQLRHLNIIKAIIQPANSQHQNNWRETHSDSIEIRKKTKLCPFYISIQYSSGGLSQSNKATKVVHRIQIRKEVKLSLFADMIVYICNPKNSLKELLQLKNIFNNVPGWKINSKEST